MDTPKFYFSLAPTYLLELFILAVSLCIMGNSSPKRKQPPHEFTMGHIWQPFPPTNELIKVPNYIEKIYILGGLTRHLNF